MAIKNDAVADWPITYRAIATQTLSGHVSCGSPLPAETSTYRRVSSVWEKGLEPDSVFVWLLQSGWAADSSANSLRQLVLAEEMFGCATFTFV